MAQITTLRNAVGELIADEMHVAMEGFTHPIPSWHYEDEFAMHELESIVLHPDVTEKQVKQETGWPLHVAENLETISEPNARELTVLRDLHARTLAAHGGETGADA